MSKTKDGRPPFDPEAPQREMMLLLAIYRALMTVDAAQLPGSPARLVLTENLFLQLEKCWLAISPGLAAQIEPSVSVILEQVAAAVRGKKGAN